jgi:hypothetical protein
VGNVAHQNINFFSPYLNPIFVWQNRISLASDFFDKSKSDFCLAKSDFWLSSEFFGKSKSDFCEKSAFPPSIKKIRFLGKIGFPAATQK